MLPIGMPVQVGPGDRNVAVPVGQDQSAQQVPFRLGIFHPLFMAFFRAGQSQFGPLAHKRRVKALVLGRGLFGPRSRRSLGAAPDKPIVKPLIHFFTENVLVRVWGANKS